MKFTLISTCGQEPAYYRIIESLDELLSLNTRFAKFYWNNFFADPHVDKELKSGELGMVHFSHPFKVLPNRELSLFKQWQSGVKIAFNKVGGWMTVNGNCKIITEIESKSWPDFIKPEKTPWIQIRKWPLGNHYYLICRKPLLLSREKYNTYEEALAEAKKHTTEDRIQYKEAEIFSYPKNGD